MEIFGDLINGQVTCPVCRQSFFRQGKVGCGPQEVPRHKDNSFACLGAGEKADLKLLADPQAKEEFFQFFLMTRLVNTIWG